jgi:hypothetical protein
MELNNSIIIVFLLAVIVILIFSNISVSMGNPDYPLNQQMYQQMYQPGTQQINQLPTQTPVSSTYNRKNDELLSNDVKKQLNILQNQFYLNNCKA